MEDISGCTNYDELPENAKKYIKRLEELIGVKISIISVGARRNETIILDNPVDCQESAQIQSAGV